MDLNKAVDQSAIQDLLLFLDLAGTFVFAISGAMLGVRQRLDIFGVLVLSFVASSAGGIMRDVLIGSVPPAAISDWRYFAVAITAGLLTFYWSSPLSRFEPQSSCSTRRDLPSSRLPEPRRPCRSGSIR